jgi:bifunctional non-homologous end joining protein LigD
MCALSPSASNRVTVDGRELTVTNLDKVLYPASGFTKGQVVDYYVRIGDVILPHLADRPVTMKRFPNGVEDESFFEKHSPKDAPEWIHHIEVHSERDATISYSVINDLPSLVWAANLAALELHVPLWHAGRRRNLPGSPDHMVFDLDPGEGTTIVECSQVAALIAKQLDGPGLESYAKTSGSKGLQLYVPLRPRATWEKVRDDAHELACTLERSHPDLVVSTMRKSLRMGKVLIDWSQNHPAKTTVAAYSLRGRPEPTVSTPVTWDEVHHCARHGDPTTLRFTADDVLKRVAEHGDLFAAV